MRKFWIVTLLLIVLFLSACNGKSTATATPGVTPEATLAGAKPGECLVSPIRFEPQPAAATYAPINTATDHIEGPDTALMTIIEYSDFT